MDHSKIIWVILMGTSALQIKVIILKAECELSFL